MNVEPAKLIIQRSGGASDMGSLTYGEGTDDNDAGRFGLDTRFALKFIRVHFSGSGSGTADVAINVDSAMGDQFDTLLFTLKTRGMGADVNFRVPNEKLLEWSFSPGDRLVLTWTNPDDGNIAWGAEVGLLEIPNARV